MNYWNNEGKYQKELDQLFADLVPGMGSCDTVAGEAIRAVSKIYYDAYNNGFCNNVTGAWNYLDHLRIEYSVPSFEAPLQCMHHMMNMDAFVSARIDPEISEALDTLVDNVVEWIISNPELKQEPTEDDMLALSDPDCYDDEYEEDEEDFYY